MHPNRRYVDFEVNQGGRHILLAVFAYGTFALAACAIALYAYWSFTPYNVVEYDTKPFHIVEPSKTVEQGGALSYEYNYVKHMLVPVTVTKHFVDGIVFQADSPVTVRPIGNGHVHAQIAIPETLPPGTYKLRITAVYRVNPIRDITIVNETEYFSVVLKGHPDATQDAAQQGQSN
jgi:hypothetical protein